MEGWIFDQTYYCILWLTTLLAWTSWFWCQVDSDRDDQSWEQASRFRIEGKGKGVKEGEKEKEAREREDERNWQMKERGMMMTSVSMSLLTSHGFVSTCLSSILSLFLSYTVYYFCTLYATSLPLDPLRGHRQSPATTSQHLFFIVWPNLVKGMRNARKGKKKKKKNEWVSES